MHRIQQAFVMIVEESEETLGSHVENFKLETHHIGSLYIDLIYIIISNTPVHILLLRCISFQTSNRFLF